VGGSGEDPNPGAPHGHRSKSQPWGQAHRNPPKAAAERGELCNPRGEPRAGAGRLPRLLREGWQKPSRGEGRRWHVFMARAGWCWGHRRRRAARARCSSHPCAGRCRPRKQEFYFCSVALPDFRDSDLTATAALLAFLPRFAADH